MAWLRDRCLARSWSFRVGEAFHSGWHVHFVGAIGLLIWGLGFRGLRVLGFGIVLNVCLNYQEPDKSVLSNMEIYCGSSRTGMLNN